VAVLAEAVNATRPAINHRALLIRRLTPKHFRGFMKVDGVVDGGVDM
jgi:hypothetical protein